MYAFVSFLDIYCETLYCVAGGTALSYLNILNKRLMDVHIYINLYCMHFYIFSCFQQFFCFASSVCSFAVVFVVLCCVLLTYCNALCAQ